MGGVKVKLLFFGTAAAEGWPAAFCQCQACIKAREKGGKNIRTRSSVLINNKYLVDFPADTYVNALREKIDLGQLEHLLITHTHRDHFYPEELKNRAQPYACLSEDNKLQVWGNSLVRDIINEYNYERVNANLVYPGKLFQAGELEVTALRAEHMEGEALLYIIKQGEKSVFYGNDSAWYPDDTWEQLSELFLDCVIFDCTYGPLPYRGGHMGIPVVLEAKDKLFDIGAINEDTILVITHFSHHSGYLYEELEDYVADKGLIVAYDGMLLEI